MLGRGRGGIEQAFCDYAQSLSAFATVHSVTRDGAEIKNAIAAIGPFTEIIQPVWYAPWRSNPITKILQDFKPDAIICHGGRAVDVVRAAKPKCPVIGVTHNYSFDRLMPCDALFAMTKHLAQAVFTHRYSGTIYYVPNMIAMDRPYTQRVRHFPPVIGVMGRMVKKKGFHVFLDALKILSRTHDFSAVIAGDGEERAALERQTRDLKLETKVSFAGWVADKDAFFDSLDVLCVPSTHEPFGLVVLEGMRAGVPVVASDIEGPHEILAGVDGAYLVPPDNAAALARVMGDMIDQPELTQTVARRQYDHAAANFSADIIGARIAASVQDACKKLNE
jgi:glycosyltransferase involved in cell wall biosynthesis